jgi:hypothetical protein
MTCVEIQFKISEWIDGGIHLSEELELKGHLERCSRCSQIYQDIKTMKERASNLDDLEPAGSLWAGIKAQLLAEGLVKEKESLWGRLFPLSLSASLKPALTGAIVTLILIGFLYFLVTKSGYRESSVSVSPEAAVFLELEKAEQHYQQAIQALNDVSQKKLDSLDPALAQIFTDNLATMDYYLQECKEAVKTNPENPLVHRYLLTAYQKKVELMQSIVNSDSL